MYTNKGCYAMISVGIKPIHVIMACELKRLNFINENLRKHRKISLYTGLFYGAFFVEVIINI